MRSPLLVATLVILLYASSLTVPFQFDDVPNIVEYSVIRDWSAVFDPGSVRGDIAVDQYGMLVRRWVGVLSFAANYAVGGLDVAGYHVVNVAIHAISAVLVWAMVRLVLLTPALSASRLPADATALTAALLFAAHPMQTQAVTYIVQRFTSLSALFYLAAMVAFLAGRLGPRRWWLASMGCAVLAMETKEIAVTLPVMVALFEVALFRGPLRRRMVALWPFALTLAVVPLGVLLTGSASPDAASDATMSGFRAGTDMAPLTYLATELPVVVEYLRLLLMPVGQTLDHDVAIRTSWLDPAVLGSGALLLGLAAGAGLLVRKGGDYTLVGLGLLWFFLALSVESSIAPIVDPMFEHRVYLPSVGIALAAAVGIASLGPRLARAVALIFLAALAFATLQRNAVWQSPITLWGEAAERSPDKARPQLNYGGALLDAGKPADALGPLRRAVELDPDYAEAHVALSRACTALGDPACAAEHLSRASALSPGSLDLLVAQANALVDQGRPELAAEIYEQAVAIDPDNADLRYNLGVSLIRAGRAPAAAPHLEAAVRLAPHNAAAHYALGSILGPIGDLDRAVVHLERAIDLAPNHALAWGDLGSVRLVQGDLEEAHRCYTEALRLDPDYAEAQTNLDRVSARIAGE